MPLPLVKDLLRNSFWDYPTYVPRPKWEYLWLNNREVYFLSKMRRAAQKPALPLPRIWQGLQFDIVDHIPRVRTARNFGKTRSIHFVNGRPIVLGSNGIKIVK